MPLVRRLTVQVSAVPLVVVQRQPWSPVVDRTRYRVMALPFVVGGVQVTMTSRFPALTLGLAGEPGTLAGVTDADAADGALAPKALWAVTVKV